jgi:hypothetical protein
VNWDAVRTFFYTEWASIAGPSLYVVVGFIAAAVAIWLVAFWSRAAVIASLRSQLRHAEERNLAFSRAFQQRSIEELATRLHTLEGYVADLPPRRLDEDQKLKLATMGAAPVDATYLVVEYESNVAEPSRYARDLIEALSRAPGWNLIDQPHPRMEHLPTPLSVGLADPKNPTAAERAVLAALRDAGLPHGLVKRPAAGMSAQIIICSR